MGRKQQQRRKSDLYVHPASCFYSMISFALSASGKEKK
jgi:hypothetical protein